MWPYTSEEQSFLATSAAAAPAERSKAPTAHEQPAGELATRTLAMPADTNPAGDMFGGWIMSQMDASAAITASHRANGRVVTAAVDAISFLKPVKAGDVLCCYTRVERVGLSSIYLRVQAWALRQGRGERVKVSEAGFTFVALDAEGKPRAVDYAPGPEPRRGDANSRPAIGPIGMIKGFYIGWLQYREFEAVLARYRAMPENELRARGLTSGDIVPAAYDEAEKRVAVSRAERGKQNSAAKSRIDPSRLPVSSRPAPA